jgi:hypothetical protein
MKLFLSLLLVANVLLFGWLRGWMAPFGGDGRDPVRIERQVQPEALRIVGQKGAAMPAPTVASAVPVAGSGSTTESRPPAPDVSTSLPPAALAVALRAANCAEVGPMSEGDAVRVQVALDALASDIAVATQRAEDTTSWWVYLPPASGDVVKRVADLRERGVTDTYVMPDGTWKGAVSLGLFRQEELAVALQKSIAAKGVKNVRVAPRGPSPGRITLQIRPVNEPVATELSTLRASLPEAIARPCAARG